MSEQRRAVILQSSYLPWKGYFDLLEKADIFVIYDSVLFSKQTWRNRNKVRTKDGTAWISIPVETSGKYHQAIDAVQTVDSSWAEKHWMAIVRSLKSAPFFDEYAADWEEWFARAAAFESLHEINVYFFTRLAETLGITTEVVRDRDVGLTVGTPTERLVALCKSVDATSYLTGPAGLDYIEREKFADADVVLESIDYSTYPSYDQVHPGFEAGVTVLDLLANVGPSAPDHLVGRVDVVSTT